MTSTIEFTDIRIERRGERRNDHRGEHRSDRGDQDARRPREDALPEHLDYHDDGCTVFPSCLSCPLPRCRYDVPGGARAMLNVERDEAIRRMRDEADLPVDEIANRFRVSRRTVFRVLTPRRERSGPANQPNQLDQLARIERLERLERTERVERIERMGGVA